MPVKLSVKLQRIAPIELKRRMLNTILRESLKAAAESWIVQDLPKHFDQGAYARYSYEARNQLYLRIKQRAKRVRPWVGRVRQGWIAAPKPPRPWVWSGLTVNDLLKRPPNGFNTKAVATTSKQTVVVPLPIQHPIPKEHAGELGKLIEAEFTKMHLVAVEKMEQMLEAIRGEIVERLAA